MEGGIRVSIPPFLLCTRPLSPPYNIALQDSNQMCLSQTNKVMIPLLSFEIKHLSG